MNCSRRLIASLEILAAILKRPDDQLRWSIQDRKLREILNRGLNNGDATIRAQAEVCRDLLLELQASSLYDHWQTMEPNEKREMVELITDKIIVGKDEITINLCYSPSVKIWQIGGGRGGIRAPNHHFPRPFLQKGQRIQPKFLTTFHDP